MDKNLLPIRQQTLEFVEHRRWQQLPASAQRECHQLLSRLLREILTLERTDDEREDK